MKQTSIKLSLVLALGAGVAHAEEWFDKSPALQLFASEQNVIHQRRMNELKPRIAELQGRLDTLAQWVKSGKMKQKVADELAAPVQKALASANALKDETINKKSTWDFAPSNATNWIDLNTLISLACNDARLKAMLAGDFARNDAIAAFTTQRMSLPIARIPGDSIERKMDDMLAAIGSDTATLKSYIALMMDTKVKTVPFLGTGQTKFTQLEDSRANGLDEFVTDINQVMTAKAALIEQLAIDQEVLAQMTKSQEDRKIYGEEAINAKIALIKSETAQIDVEKRVVNATILGLANFYNGIFAREVYTEAQYMSSSMFKMGLSVKVVEADGTSAEYSRILPLRLGNSRTNVLGSFANYYAKMTAQLSDLASIQTHLKNFNEVREIALDLASPNTTQAQADGYSDMLSKKYVVPAPTTKPATPASAVK